MANNMTLPCMKRIRFYVVPKVRQVTVMFVLSKIMLLSEFSGYSCKLFLLYIFSQIFDKTGVNFSTLSLIGPSF